MHTLILHDEDQASFYVSIAIGREQAGQLVESLTHSDGTGVFRYMGATSLNDRSSTGRYHKFSLDVRRYAWLIGAAP